MPRKNAPLGDLLNETLPIEPGAIAQFLLSPCNGFRLGPSFRNRDRPTDQLCFQSGGQYLGELGHGPLISQHALRRRGVTRAFGSGCNRQVQLPSAQLVVANLGRPPCQSGAMNRSFSLPGLRAYVQRRGPRPAP